MLFLGIQLVPSSVSLNVKVPHQGDADLMMPDGKLAPLTVFGICIVVVFIVASTITYSAWCKIFYPLSQINTVPADRASLSDLQRRVTARALKRTIR